MNEMPSKQKARHVIGERFVLDTKPNGRKHNVMGVHKDEEVFGDHPNGGEVFDFTCVVMSVEIDL